MVESLSPQNFLRSLERKNLSKNAEAKKAQLQKQAPSTGHSSQISQASIGTFSKFQNRKLSLTKIAVGVIDAANLVETSKSALSKQKKNLHQLRSLLIDASQNDVSPEKRSHLDEKMNHELDLMETRVQLSRHDGLRVLGQDIQSAFVQTGENHGEGISIELTKADLESLELADISVESPQSSLDALSKVEKAIVHVNEGEEQLEKTHDLLKNAAAHLEAELNDVLNVQKSLGKFNPLELVEGIDEREMKNSHSRSGSLISQLNQLS